MVSAYDRSRVGGLVRVEVGGQGRGLPQQVITEPAQFGEHRAEQPAPFAPPEQVKFGPQVVDHAFALLRPGVVAVRGGGDLLGGRRDLGQQIVGTGAGLGWRGLGWRGLGWRGLGWRGVTRRCVMGIRVSGPGRLGAGPACLLAGARFRGHAVDLAIRALVHGVFKIVHGIGF